MKPDNLYLAARVIVASGIVAFTAWMIATQRSLPDAWWAMSTAALSYLFPPKPNGLPSLK